jgi:hypothetical protein
MGFCMEVFNHETKKNLDASTNDDQTRMYLCIDGDSYIVVYYHGRQLQMAQDLSVDSRKNAPSIEKL